MAPEKRNPTPPESPANSDRLHSYLPSPTDTTTTTPGPGSWWKAKDIDSRTWKGVAHVYFEIFVSFIISLSRTIVNLAWAGLQQIWRLPKLVLGGSVLAIITWFFFGSAILAGVSSVANFDVSFGHDYSMVSLWDYGIAGEDRGFSMPVDLFAAPGQVARGEEAAKKTTEVVVTYASLTTVSSSSTKVAKSSSTMGPTKVKSSEVVFESIVQRAIKPISSNSLVTDPVQPEFAEVTGGVKSPIITTTTRLDLPLKPILPGQLPPFRPDFRGPPFVLRITEKYVALTDIEKFLEQHVTVLTLSATASIETTLTGRSTLTLDTTPLAVETPLREL